MIIGLTGKSCAGKDTVAALLPPDRFTVIDVDALGHVALEANHKALREAFGDGIFSADGKVDRKVLGPIVFSNPEKLKTLNAITHPWMRDEALRMAHEAESEGKRAVINAALLESMGFVPCCDLIVLVVAPYAVRAKRALERDGMTGRPAVNFRLDSEGASIFHRFTSAHIGDQLAVVMDGRVKSVAVINDAISGDVQLTGSFTEEEAQSLAVVLRTSSLPIDLTVVSQQGVGASLGSDSVNVALKAILVGFLLVILCMIVYYGPAGIIADVALMMNFLMMIAVLSAMHFTLTLSSIAGLVLTLGMAIDANVIIYERIKEEMEEGLSVYEAVKLGFGRAFWTIMDSNVTTIIAAIVLSVLGSSTVKGFANTLAIGVACSLFTSLFVSHLLFDFFISEEKGNVWFSWRRKK